MAVDVRVADSINQMPAVHGHPIVIAQILGNLMVNAAEAIQETGRVSGRFTYDGPGSSVATRGDSVSPSA